MFETKIYSHVVNLSHVNYLHAKHFIERSLEKGWQVIDAGDSFVVTKAAMMERA